MALGQECLLPVAKKCSLEEDKKEEKNSLPRNFSSLKKRSEFLYIRKVGKTVYGKYFIINYYFSDKENLKVGLTVSKKMGNAIIRNYLKRVFRYIIRKNLYLIPKHLNIEIIPKKKIEKQNFNNVESDLVNILKDLVI